MANKNIPQSSSNELTSPPLPEGRPEGVQSEGSGVRADDPGERASLPSPLMGEGSGVRAAEITLTASQALHLGAAACQSLLTGHPTAESFNRDHLILAYALLTQMAATARRASPPARPLLPILARGGRV